MSSEPQARGFCLLEKTPTDSPVPAGQDLILLTNLLLNSVALTHGFISHLTKIPDSAAKGGFPAHHGNKL